MSGKNSIGQLGEKSLHASLKTMYAAEGEEEFPVAGYVADVKTPQGLVEIQTGNFAKIRRKITRLLEEYNVRLVYPAAEEKNIVTLNIDGEIISRRKSPKKGKPALIGRELAAIRDLIGHPRFELEIVMTIEEDIRVNDGKGSWRRKGISLEDRRLISITRRILMKSPEDYLILLNGKSDEEATDLKPFSNRDLSSRLGIPLSIAGGLTRSLLTAGILTIADKKGNARIFIPRK